MVGQKVRDKMLIVDINKPNNCRFCILWSKCKVYKKRLQDNADSIGKPMCNGCLIKGEMYLDLEEVQNKIEPRAESGVENG